MQPFRSESDRDWFLVRDWTTKAGLRAVVILGVWKLKMTMLHDHYNGYVEIPEGDTERYEDTQSVDVHGEVTFQGALKGFDHGKEFVGFDMAHVGDENIPDPKKYAYAQCEKLAKQLKAKQK